jgi:hypothetical protein
MRHSTIYHPAEQWPAINKYDLALLLWYRRRKTNKEKAISYP